MILPTKNQNLDQSPILAGAMILNQLKSGSKSVDDIFRYLRKDFQSHYWVIGLRAINILFLSGAIAYNENNDRMELTHEID